MSRPKRRHRIHYALILCILLIQGVIAIFFYNEYFNSRKLEDVQTQIEQGKQLKEIMNRAGDELSLAQVHLQKYGMRRDSADLDAYFQSLNRISLGLDSIQSLSNNNPRLRELIAEIRNKKVTAPYFKALLDSSYQMSRQIEEEKPAFKTKPFDLKASKKEFDIQVVTTTDSLKKKGLFKRIGAAIKGDVDTRNTTTVITSKQGKSIDPEVLRRDYERALDDMNQHYLKEIARLRDLPVRTDFQESPIFQVYDRLLNYGRDLMKIYDLAVGEFNDRLEAEYNKQNSINSRIRNYAVLGLMILMFFVLIGLYYYTRQAFLYERKLRSANRKIRENLKFKSRLLGMLSHEIRSPLKIMDLFIDRIGKRVQDEKTESYLDSMRFTTNSLLIQANQILDYTKNQEKKMELHPVPFNLNHELTSVFNIFGPYIESRHNRFEIDNRVDPGLQVLGDNIKLNQVLVNLLGNANKFTEDGTISVFAKAEQGEGDRIKLSVKVSDTGIGISEQDLHRIFESYYQGVASDEIDNVGAGLGLNLCKEIIKLCGGDFSVNSKEREGTQMEFWINLKNTKHE